MFLYLGARHFSISEWYSRLYPQLLSWKKSVFRHLSCLLNVCWQEFRGFSNLQNKTMHLKLANHILKKMIPNHRYHLSTVSGPVCPMCVFFFLSRGPRFERSCSIFPWCAISKSTRWEKNEKLGMLNWTTVTPWKFNIAPENIPSQKESSLPTIIFRGLC